MTRLLLDAKMSFSRECSRGMTFLVFLICILICQQQVVNAFVTPIGKGSISTQHHPAPTIIHNHVVAKSPFAQSFTSTSSSSLKRVSNTSLSATATLNPAILKASFSATAKLLSSIGIGALMTPSGPKQFGRVLDGTAVSSLSKLTYWIFQPSFLLVGVAGTLANASTASASAAVGLPKSALFTLPLAALVQIGLGALSAKLITTRKLNVRPTLLGIDTNDDDSANDIRMCTTFANSGPLPLILSEAMFKGSIFTDVSACVSFYLLIWSPLFWTFGRMILGTLAKDETSTDDSVVGKVVKQIKMVLSPPVIGSLLGVLIGSNPILRDMIVKPNGLLSPVFGALKTLGVAYLPAAVLVLAGSLVGGNKSSTATSTETNQNNPKSSSIHPKTILSILASRFLLSPILALTTVRLLTLANLLPSSTSNPRALAIITYTLLMEGCMPPAQNSVIMLQLDGKKERAAKMAKMLTVIYALSTVPVTLLLSGVLGISGILKFS